jgi:hypothetical protein
VNAKGAPWWRPLSHVDRWSLVVLVAVPALLIGVPALVGHPAIEADNLIQNFPLRVLAGRQILSGHLPLFNPYANSGTPLLGGLNAGALYPGTLLFAVLPAQLAWALNLIAVYAAAGVGLYALARYYGLRPLGSLVGALSYAYLGAMVGQVVHLGVVQGFSLLPWAALAMVGLAERLGGVTGARATARAAMGPLLALSGLWGLTFLSGEPRAYAELELLTLVLGAGIVLLPSRARPRTWLARGAYLTTVGLGVLWGAALSLVQLLPGWAFIGFSQRSQVSYWFFGSGSMSWKWTPLLFVNDLFGGNGVAGQARYFASYNLPEVTGYAGIVALCAVGAYLTRLTRRGWRDDARDLSPYLVLLVVGLFATWGNYLVTGHLFRALPFFGSTRLQSRNVILVDLAAAMLAAWWVDRLESRDWRGAGLLGARRLLTLAPAAAVAALALLAAVDGRRLVGAMGLTTDEAALAGHQPLTMALHVALALALVVVALGAPRRGDVRRAVLGLVVVDVVVFLATCATGFVSSGYPTQPSRQVAVSAFGTQGRSAVVDVEGSHYREFIALGAPNTNVFTRVPSVQGYGSLISTIYDRATGTHPMDLLNPCALRKGTFTQLRLGALAIAAGQLTTSVGGHIGAPAWCLAAPKGPVTSRYFGRVVELANVELRAAGSQLAAGDLTVSALGASGRVVGAPVVESGARASATIDLGGVRAAGVEVRGRHLDLVDAVATPARGPAMNLDTPFNLALAGRGWHLTSTVADYAVVRQRHVEPAAWVARGGAGRVVSVREASWGDSWVSVATPTSTTVLRSQAYLPGWRASAVSSSGARREFAVTRHGLIEAITVPAGRWTVHFHYHAPHIELGVIGSAAATVLWVVVGALLWRGRRRVN